jgi:sulfonate transport system ATP-binding protein
VVAAQASEGATVRLTRVDKAFGDRNVLRDLTLDVRPSEFIAVVGRSGSGKSTLLRLLCGLEAPSGGEVSVVDAHGASLLDRVRVVFQEPRLLPWRSVLANVALGRPQSDVARALAVLSRVGLRDRADDYPGVLSGGQQQRVALARALLHEPRLLLLDEPFGALDALTRIEAQQLVGELWAEARFTTILVTHDVSEAVLLSDRVLVVEDGAIADEVIIDLPRPRTRALPEVGRLTALVLDRVMKKSASQQSEQSSPTRAELDASAIESAQTRVWAHVR